MSKKKNESFEDMSAMSEVPSVVEEGTPVVAVNVELEGEIMNGSFRIGSVVKVVNGRQLVGCIGTISEILENTVKLEIVFPGPSSGNVETSDKSFAVIRY